MAVNLTTGSWISKPLTAAWRCSTGLPMRMSLRERARVLFKAVRRATVSLL